MPQDLRGFNYFIQTFGCQMNKHDTERICGMLDALGANQVSEIEESDISIYMTCCVRESADTRLYGHVSSLKSIPVRHDSPSGKRLVAVGGCIGQRDGKQLMDRIGNIDIVFGTQNIPDLPNLISEAAIQGKASRTLDQPTSSVFALPIKQEQSHSAWLPITSGCNNFCTYCIVPYVRGRERSRELSDIVEEAKGYVANGVKEITLLGQNVNSYGRDLYGSPRFYDVLNAVSETGIERLRFATSHPKDLTDDVIGLFGKLVNLMPALHLPIQSGSNRILAEMNRRYDRDHYLELIEKLRQACPEIALSTDVIVGFPGESEEDFQDTCNLIDKVGYHQVFTFKFSPRSGTPAASMDGRIESDIVQDRFDRLRLIVEDRAYALNQLDEDCKVNVLFDGPSKKDSTIATGKSPKNQTVNVPCASVDEAYDMKGQIREVIIEDALTWYLKGRFVDR